MGRKEKREGEYVRVKSALTLTLPRLSPLFAPATQDRKDKEMEQLCVRITWTNRSEEKPDLGVDQYRQYRITLNIEGTLSPCLQFYKNLEFRSVKTPTRAYRCILWL